MAREKIVLAAGCFWGVQYLLDRIDGVVETRCGYVGGDLPNPTYRDICTGKTGHAEAVEVVFENEKISLTQVLSYFWRLHDPTQLNRQGVDIGTQYRSAIFYTNPQQKETAEKSKDEFNKSGVFKKLAVTEVVPLTQFYSAEDSHQKYFDENGGHICHVMRLK
jgi:peptide-methionine (S)-S-oxide reductase